MPTIADRATLHRKLTGSKATILAGALECYLAVLAFRGWTFTGVLPGSGPMSSDSQNVAMTRAFAIGLGIVISLMLSWLLPEHILWFVPRQIKECLGPFQRSLLGTALESTGLIAAGWAAGALAPRAKVRLASALALPTALLYGLAHLAAPWFGVYVDLQGVEGSVFVAIVMLVISFLLCGLGGVFAFVIARARGT